MTGTYYFSGEIFTTLSANFDYESVNIFVLQVTVSDGLLKDRGNLTVFIDNVNERPVLFNLPSTVIISEHHAGDVYAVEAEDPESTLLNYDLSSDPSSGNSLFSINSSSGMSDSNPVNTKHLYYICTMLDQRRRRWADIVQMLYNDLCLLRIYKCSL